VNSPTLQRLTERPFGAAAIDPAKVVPTSSGGSPAPTLRRTLSGTSGPTSTVARVPSASPVNRALGDTTTWTPRLNSGTDRGGAPMYDNASVQRLLDRRPDLPRLQNPVGGKPDFSNVRTGAAAGAAPPVAALRSMTDTSSPVAPAASPATGAPGMPVLRRTLDPSPVSPSTSSAPQVQAATARAVDGISANTVSARSRITSALLNPMGNDAELVRRLENSQRSAAGRGSPQARRLLAQPYLDALGLAGKADAEGLTAGNQAMLQMPSLEAAAHEGAARRRLEADTFNVDAGYRERVLANETATRRAELERPTLETDADGRLLRVTGTTAAPVTGADGSQVRMPQRTARDYQADSDDRLLAELLGMQKDPATGEFAVDALSNARQQLAEIRGRGGAEPRQEGSPYAEGRRLVGPDGRYYVVTNGQPVAED